MRTTGLLSGFAILLIAGVLQGCGDPLSLTPARFENTEDTLRIYAARGTAVNLPSAYSIVTRSVVRLDQASAFDFIFDIDNQGRPVMLPLGAVVATGNTSGIPGFLHTTTPFDNITIAEQVGYVTKDTVLADLGQTYYIRSVLDGTCQLGIPYYAKLEVLAVDPASRSMRFRIIANVNCGYRGLEVGLPKK